MGIGGVWTYLGYWLDEYHDVRIILRNLSLVRSETVKNGSRRAKARFGDSQLNLVRKIAFRSFKGSNDSAL